MGIDTTDVDLSHLSSSTDAQNSPSRHADTVSEDLWRLTLEHLTDTVLLTDEAGLFTFVCPNVHHIFDLNADRVVKLGNVRELLDIDPLRNDALQESGSLENLERTIVTPGGNRRKILVNVRTIDSSWGTYLFACRDVTGIFREQSERQTMQRRLDDIASNLQDVIWMCEIDFANLLYVNAAYEELFDQPVDQLYRDPLAFMDRVQKQDRARLRSQMRMIRQCPEDAPYEVEYRITTNGETRWCRTKGYAVENQQGNYDRIVGFTQDITTEKQTRNKLQKNEHRLRMALEAAQAGLWELNMDTGQEEWDKNLYRIYGLDPEEFDQTYEAFLERVHPQDRVRIGAILDQALDEAEPFSVEYRIQRNGEVRWIESRGEVVPPPAFQDETMIGIAMDITERKKTEEALKKSEQKFRQLAETIDEVFWLSTADKELLYVNPAFEDVWGIPTEEFKNDIEVVLEHVHPDDRSRVREAMFHHQTKGDYDEEFRIVRPDGEERWIRDRAFPIEDEEGTVSRIVGIAEDITEQKQLQHELESLVEERTMLLEEVNHRVKNNLQMIISMINLQLRTMSPPEEVATYFRNLSSRIYSMALIHNQMYQLDSFDSLNAREYFQDLAEHVLESQSAESLELELMADLEPVELDIDTLLPCGLILNELLTNAIQHGFEGRDHGRVEIEFHPVDENRYEMIVSDNGKGWQAEESLEELSSMGMRLVKNLVQKQLHGEFELIEPEQGLTIKMLITRR